MKHEMKRGVKHRAKTRSGVTEYETRVKRIGGSSYLLLPPELVRSQGFKDESEVHMKARGRTIFLESKKVHLDKPAKEIVDAMKKGLDLDYRITREEIYETDRY